MGMNYSLLLKIFSCQFSPLNSRRKFAAYYLNPHFFFNLRETKNEKI